MKLFLRPTAALLTATLLAFTGCTTRSISHSNFEAARAQHHANAARYELSEFDVLGLDPNETASDEAIAATLAANQKPILTAGSKLLLIQSGAAYPDAPMVDCLRKHFAVETFSGVAQREPDPTKSYSRTLRLLAAKGGYDKIVCYWGVLESERTISSGAVRTVSWMPVVGDFVPDEREHMRIRLKAAVIDVASGRWTLVTPPAFNDSSLSTFYSRKKKDQQLVTALKAKGYAALAEQLAQMATVAQR